MLVMEHIFLSKKAHFYASLDPIIQGNELCLSTEKKIVGWGLSYNYISQQNKSLTWYGQSSNFIQVIHIHIKFEEEFFSI